ncbi:hypothetical protein Pmani_036512 [Petrolisthes manimaculis]|uniref:Uncharacterized protein n=1 Tax=Petrolisthes manimaculis TaxID=1843537 RepID=A0AAE1TPB9_9EUCA|nr:hypothetical protein Pmani_036512 [Petrolisthes manimaculis]
MGTVGKEGQARDGREEKGKDGQDGREEKGKEGQDRWLGMEGNMRANVGSRERLVWAGRGWYGPGEAGMGRTGMGWVGLGWDWYPWAGRSWYGPGEAGMGRERPGGDELGWVGPAGDVARQQQQQAVGGESWRGGAGRGGMGWDGTGRGKAGRRRASHHCPLEAWSSGTGLGTGEMWG